MFLGFGGNQFGRSAFLIKEDDGANGGKRDDDHKEPEASAREIFIAT